MAVKVTKPKGLPKTGGRKEVKIDIEELQKLAAMGCTQKEIADWFKVSVGTLERKLADPETRIEYDHGVSHMKVSIRRQQMSQAASGNTTMLIWLGKQYLGQKDKVENTQVDERETQTLEEFLDTAKKLLEYEGKR